MRKPRDAQANSRIAPPGSFLVADEVGLGKTLVARGVIAEFIERKWDGVRRIDIIYLCSNAALARENLSKLKAHGDLGKTLPATRFTLLPRELRHLHEKLNFISVTPDTALSVRGGGRVDERRVLYQLLRREFGEDVWLKDFFQHYVDKDRWRASVNAKEDLDAEQSAAFLRNVEAAPELMARLEAMREPFAGIDGQAARAAAPEPKPPAQAWLPGARLLEAAPRTMAEEAPSARRGLLGQGAPQPMHARGEDGWVARFRLYPALILEKPTKATGPRRESEAVYFASCAGGIRGRYYGPEVMLEVRVA